MSIPLKDKAHLRYGNRIPGTRMVFTYSRGSDPALRGEIAISRKKVIWSFLYKNRSLPPVRDWSSGVVCTSRDPCPRFDAWRQFILALRFNKKKEFFQFSRLQSRTHDLTLHIPVANHYTIVTPLPEVTTTTKYPPSFFFEKNQVSHSSLYNLIFQKLQQRQNTPHLFF